MQLETSRLILKAPDVELAPLVYDYFTRNRLHFEPYSPAHRPQWDTIDYHRNKLLEYGEKTTAGTGLWLFLFDKSNTGTIVGDVHLSNITRGVFQSCNLGYKLDEHAQGKGYMREAIQRVVQYAFDEMQLHRVEANIMPANTRSINLVKVLGFEEEGLAKKYLKINGHWQHHIRYSLRNEAIEH